MGLSARLVWSGVLLGVTAAATNAQLVDPRANVSVASGVDDLAVLTGSTSDDAARFEAAKRLVLKPDDATGAAVAAALRDGGTPGAQRALARAILAVDPGSPRFALALRDALGSASTAACVADLLAALDHYPIRPTVAAIVDRLNSGATPDDVRTVLSDALSRWTGCDSCAAGGVAAWGEWWARVRTLDDAAWTAELARNYRARSERLLAAHATIEARMVDLYNALYAASTPERRGDVIGSMLRDDLPRVKRVGLDLASRTLLNAQPLGPGVAAAAVDLLSCEQEDIRASAARLVENLGTQADHSTIAALLERERSPRVAGPLLRLSARTVGTTPTPTLLRWLDAPEPAGSAAADAILSVHAAGLLTDDDGREALRIVAALDPATMPAAQARLLASLGGPDDRATIRLVAERSAIASARRSAGLALAASPEELSFLLRRARTDAALYEGAARGVGLHRATASGFLELVAVSPSESTWIEPASRALLALPPDQRLSALRALDDAARRDALVSAALPHLAPAEGRELLLLQAESRLSRGDAEGALEAANAALRDAPATFSRAEHARFYALAFLGRLEDALAVTPGEPADCWLEALRRCSTLAHAPRMLALVDEHFAASMTPAQRRSLDDLRGRIVARPDGQGASPGGVDAGPAAGAPVAAPYPG